MSGRILIIDDIPTNRALLKAKLATAFFDVTTVDSDVDVTDLARSLKPDLILIDVTGLQENGYDLCRQLKANPYSFHIPVIMITITKAMDQRILGLNAGADDFLNKPFDEVTLIARVRSLMRVKIMFDEMRLRDDTTRDLGLDNFLQDVPSFEHVEGTVLVSTCEGNERHDWKGACLRAAGISAEMAKGEAATLLAAYEDRPDLLILDYPSLGASASHRAISAFKSEKSTRNAAIIFVVGEGQEELAASALDLGANDYIIAPFDPNELMVRVRSQLRRKQYSDRLRSNVVDGLRMAVIDPLTGLYNRRYAQQHLETISARAALEDVPYSILMLDLDEFKRVNDRYGHAAGDDVLVEFSRRLQENLRNIDLVARIGGEEFFVAMPATAANQALIVAERLRAAIEQRPFKVQAQSVLINVTVSIGVATSAASASSAGHVMQNADEALFVAKQAGRNDVKVFSKLKTGRPISSCSVSPQSTGYFAQKPPALAPSLPQSDG